MGRLFGAKTRTDRTAKRYGESTYAFLDRSALPQFPDVRDLLEDWLAHLPIEGRSSMLAELRGDDHHFEATFFELYLHEAYRRSGAAITIHPPTVSGKHPDFLIESDLGRFYLEATSVGETPERRAETARLEDVERVLALVPADRFTLMHEWHRIGPRPMPSARLSRMLIRWLESLPVESSASTRGLRDLPVIEFRQDGWHLRFTALSRRLNATPGSLVGVRGPASARVVVGGRAVLRVLDGKANKYNPLDAPLVIAVLNNAEDYAREWQLQQALYGLAAIPPAAAQSGDLHSDGHWMTRAGWRRSHAPQVITVTHLKPWTITRTVSWLWSSLDPQAAPPSQPGWLAPVDVTGQDPVVSHAGTATSHFGLPDDWLATAPAFEG